MRNFFFLLLFTCFSFSLAAQNNTVFHLDSIPEKQESYNDPGIPVLIGWKYHKGDNMEWANADFADSSWIYIAPSINLKEIPEGTFTGTGWFRLHIIVDTSLLGKTLAFMITHSGASEIYLDDKLIHSFGKIDVKNPENEERFDPQLVPVDILFEKTREHVLAVRYVNAKALEYHKKNLASICGFDLKLGKLSQSSFYKYSNSNVTTAIFIFYFTFFIALSFLHFIFFLFYRKKRSNLYYSIFAGAFGTVFLGITIQKNFLLPDLVIATGSLFSILSDFYIPALLAMLYSIFYEKLPKIFWLWFVIFLFDFIMGILHIDIKYSGWVTNAIFGIESLRIIIAAIIKKKEGSGIIGAGIITSIVFFMFFFIMASAGNANFTADSPATGILFGLIVICATLSIPISMTVYLARDFAKTSKNLSKKLLEVEELSAKNIEQEKEKQKILESQKENLELQVKERTAEIIEQKQVIEEKNKDITDSILYAKKIQEAILPDKEIKYRIFPDAFVLFKPKDIVSGDFYWFTEKNGKRIIAACDCTGHGVPGALMSMIGNNILHQTVNEKGITNPGEILDNLHNEVYKALKQDDQANAKDGMDLALITFTGETEIEYAGAHRPLWIIRTQNILEEIKGDKFSIGGTSGDEQRNFKNHKINLSKGDRVYLFSDGYADQFSSGNKKLMTKKLKEILLTIQSMPMAEQEKYLDNFIEKWKGGFEQTDDILVIGITI